MGGHTTPGVASRGRDHGHTPWRQHARHQDKNLLPYTEHAPTDRGQTRDGNGFYTEHAPTAQSLKPVWFPLTCVGDGDAPPVQPLGPTAFPGPRAGWGLQGCCLAEGVEAGGCGSCSPTSGARTAFQSKY